MTSILNTLTTQAEKLQGTAARLTMRLPSFSQRALAKVLGFNHEHSRLDPHLQIIVTARELMGGGDLLSKNPEKSRHRFHKEMVSIVRKPTPVAAVTNWDIKHGLVKNAVRYYSPLLNSRSKRENKLLPLLVFFHGGGFFIGDLDTHDEACRVLCQHGQFNVLSVAYRLAPEHPAPAGIEDCLNALKWAHEHASDLSIDPTKIAVGGDSAGGNLAAVISQLAAGKPYAPVAQLLLYPVVDFVNKYPSHKTYGKGLFLDQSDMDNATHNYLAHSQVPLSDPRVSPIFGDLTGLPPALLVTAELDTLRDEGELYAMKMREAGSKCIAHRVEGQGHGFMNITPINRAAFKSIRRIAHDFRALLDGKLDR
ncbi:MAG: alpha/beta hydrolase [Aquirhabdus sp.]